MVDVLVAAPLRLELHWEQGVLAETVLGWAGEGEKPVLLTEEARSVQACLVRYVAGEDVEWPSLPLAWDRVTPFRRRVLQALVADVPAGAVTTYGDLAARAGSPDAARAVGGAMANNPWPLLIPCHRVLGGGGRLGGFSGAGLPMKRWLLDHEGCADKGARC
ncbi:methylated-DNA--[protein]-cysteine S-methyltransferase [Nitratidesulfovibrio vulgaris]|jgi:methylated-DNA-[protein]-cysteine S-methyltransferase|uniref:Methylated-DNA--protein-cysteine methyltransferase n=2 Tax=Nitratidesulfovibrio vulgaris TaxID=881 RepID=Q72DY8_NITV2|nr:methylated-DNA--[protein]-cysteine S-methyltransferase [Nitratidesulfovibrio vulgaris]GEB79839.1 methylated-DNA--protein-cysteine methyltransferase [Desulfovibrio desulfuricans]HBW16113.1 methylated-DNA--[protein]-cysteine S-methyltransferase [Desulfovibrio sp.]AAS95271.1 methylated-DNA--protein-cysteine methyltransferase, DNA-binding domain protein [Nitratidesulfovibrio vulgaris str. Hildenborough]ABM29198.1 methylated-DNA--protein-cysteine methyltransferase [Nitratidesulfovibrio vulgaris D